MGSRGQKGGQRRVGGEIEKRGARLSIVVELQRLHHITSLKNTANKKDPDLPQRH